MSKESEKENKELKGNDKENATKTNDKNLNETVDAKTIDTVTTASFIKKK